MAEKTESTCIVRFLTIERLESIHRGVTPSYKEQNLLIGVVWVKWTQTIDHAAPHYIKDKSIVGLGRRTESIYSGIIRNRKGTELINRGVPPKYKN